MLGDFGRWSLARLVSSRLDKHKLDAFPRPVKQDVGR